MQFGWTADEPTSISVLDSAFEAGINFIDTADIYSRWAEGNPGGVAEAILGRWLAANPSRRGQVVVATKVRGPMGDGPNDAGLSRVHILNAVEASLRRMGTETIDLYQTHWPDEDTPIDETLEAMDSLVRRGLVRSIGCSNYPAAKLLQALRASGRTGWARFECLQPHYNLMHRSEYEHELESVCVEYGLGVIPYSRWPEVSTGKMTQRRSVLSGSCGVEPEDSWYLRRPRNWRAAGTLCGMNGSNGLKGVMARPSSVTSQSSALLGDSSPTILVRPGSEQECRMLERPRHGARRSGRKAPREYQSGALSGMDFPRDERGPLTHCALCNYDKC
jgi:aryl-alcohol dehydrogenase-like predicted oxidoreductase